VIPGPEVTVMADADQLEQMLINLRNAAEAVLEGPPSKAPGNDVSAPTNGFEPTVSIGWKVLTRLSPWS
jgi:C4-dicarboxylate-specific signal transduction histidine kinase